MIGKKLTKLSMLLMSLAVAGTVWLSVPASAGCAGGASDTIASAIMWTLTALSVGFAATGVGAPIGFGFGVAALGLYTLDLAITAALC